MQLLNRKIVKGIKKITQWLKLLSNSYIFIFKFNISEVFIGSNIFQLKSQCNSTPVSFQYFYVPRIIAYHKLSQYLKKSRVDYAPTQYQRWKNATPSLRITIIDIFVASCSK